MPPIPKKTKSLSPYFTEEDVDQIRAALNAVGRLEGYASISELVEAATLRELRRLQRKYNGGKKWPGIPCRADPTRQANPRGKPPQPNKIGRIDSQPRGPAES